MFWISPALLAQGPLPGILQAFATAAIGVWLLACATEGWMRNGPLALPLRLVSAAGGLMLMIPEGYSDLAGLGVAAGLFLYQYKRYPEDIVPPAVRRA
jgi:TRAP-type uncharacterized transport system fused permease subunit